jgi:hypothetical protein
MQVHGCLKCQLLQAQLSKILQQVPEELPVRAAQVEAAPQIRIVQPASFVLKESVLLPGEDLAAQPVPGDLLAQAEWEVKLGQEVQQGQAAQPVLVGLLARVARNAAMECAAVSA